MNNLVNEISELYKRDLNRLRKEISLYEREELLWKVVPGTINSGGHLCQHLIGNLMTYIGQALGGYSYTRDREAEFGTRRFDQQQLDQELQTLSALLMNTLTQLDDDQLRDSYPKDVLDLFPDQTVSIILLHLLTHLSYHTGQINYHRRNVSTNISKTQN